MSCFIQHGTPPFIRSAHSPRTAEWSSIVLVYTSSRNLHKAYCGNSRQLWSKCQSDKEKKSSSRVREGKSENGVPVASSPRIIQFLCPALISLCRLSTACSICRFVVAPQCLGVLLPRGEHRLIMPDVPRERIIGQLDPVGIPELGADLGNRPVPRGIDVPGRPVPRNRNPRLQTKRRASCRPPVPSFEQTGQQITVEKA